MEDYEVVSCPLDMGPIEEILFVGSGTSACVPMLSCISMGAPPHCKVCLDAVGRHPRTPAYNKRHGGPPTGLPSRNFRTNPSVAIRYRHSDGTLHAILIDCGKTFYHNAVKHLFRAGIRELDGVLITHGHADAIFGLDDLRHWAGHHGAIQAHVDVHCDGDTFESIRTTFPYLVDPTKATGGGEVSLLKFHQFAHGREATIRIGELEIRPVPLLHGSHSDGRDYFASGFIINGFYYFSDISGIPPMTQQALDELGTPKVLVVDCLHHQGAYKSHWCWPQTHEFIKQSTPNLSIVVGMSHGIDYYAFQRQLDADRGITDHDEDGIISKVKYHNRRVLVGFDGMLLKFNP